MNYRPEESPEQAIMEQFAFATKCISARQMGAHQGRIQKEMWCRHDHGAPRGIRSRPWMWKSRSVPAKTA